MSLNKLIENIITSGAYNNNVKFELTKSYVSNATNNINANYDNELPVDVNDSTWETIENNNKKYLTKIYRFKDKEHLKYFLDAHISKSTEINYEPELFLKGQQIKCFLYTEELDDITEIDVEYSNFLDEIYEDIFFME